MAGIIDKIAIKLSKFLDSKIIFVIDCFLSMMSSLFALLALGFIRKSLYQSGRFALPWLLSALVATVVAMLIFKGHKIIIRHLSPKDLFCFVKEALLKTALMTVAMLLTYHSIYTGVIIALGADFLFTLFLLVFVRIIMVMVYQVYQTKRREDKMTRRVLVWGFRQVHGSGCAFQELHALQYRRFFVPETATRASFACQFAGVHLSG